MLLSLRVLGDLVLDALADLSCVFVFKKREKEKGRRKINT